LTAVTLLERFRHDEVTIYNSLRGPLQKGHTTSFIDSVINNHIDNVNNHM